MKKSIKEALEIVGSVHLEFPTHPHISPISCSIETYQYAFKVVKEALTPPTADEVCKALSEYYSKTNYKVVYSIVDKSFRVKDNYLNHFDIAIKNDTGIMFGYNLTLPPHLITLIGRFYEDEKK